MVLVCQESNKLQVKLVKLHLRRQSVDNGDNNQITMTLVTKYSPFHSSLPFEQFKVIKFVCKSGNFSFYFRTENSVPGARCS